MERTERVDLAHVPSFSLGRISVRPAHHQLVRDDGENEIVQHRVMQVLVALARAEGEIVTRDELTMSCWDGRVVGEDAINRIMSRLRALEAGIGQGSFRLETVTRVGYRLVSANPAPATEAIPSPAVPAPPPLEATAGGVSRRLILGGSLAGLAAAAAAGVLILRDRRPASPAVPPGVPPLMDQARVALRQTTREGQNQAIGLYRRVVALAPDYADGWGALGHAYSLAAYYRSDAESRALRARARAAGGRSLAIDSDNALGELAIASAEPVRGNWLVMERALRRAMLTHADNELLLFALAEVLVSVGRNRAAAILAERMATIASPTPGLYFFRIRILWSVNRLEEADRLMDEAASTYPTQYAIWFTRFYILLYTGRAATAIALAEDRDRHPTGIPQAELDSVLRVARAVESGSADQRASVIAEQMARARTGAGYAENAIQFACALGNVDVAFDIAAAYYFGRGFTVPELRFTPLQATYTLLSDRLTLFLFLPVTAPMRADPRFAHLVSELGLERYWSASGTTPDYRRR